MQVSLYWSTNTGMAMCKSLQENVTYENALASSAMICMNCSSYLNGLSDGRQVAIQMLFWGEASSRICSRQSTKFLSRSHLAFPPCILSVSVWCIHTVVLIQVQFERNPVWFYQTSMNDNLPIAFPTFTRLMLTSLSIDEILLPRFVNWSNNFSLEEFLLYFIREIRFPYSR